MLMVGIVILLAGCGGDDEDNPYVPLPQAGNVFPADGATGLPPATVLMWTAAEAPVKAFQHYRVLMGGGPDALAHVATTVETHLVRRDLALGATFYWAVEAVGDDGATTRGGPWSFATADTLATPVVSRFINGEPWAFVDTVGYGQPVVLSWSAVMPLAATTPPEALALLDTVAPSTDGILGYQYAFTANVPPLPTEWQPHDHFGDVQDLTITDLHLSGLTALWVNALDFAGGTVGPPQSLVLQLVVNFDPDTHIERTRTYPYYVVFHGPEAGEYNFADGDTVPDRAYVVVRALGWDDPRDVPLSPPGELRFQGAFQATGRMFGELPFSFSTSYSTPSTADTLGFLVGPFDYAVTMRAVDEHDRRDGTPDTLRFHANFPPCVQCIELVNAEAATQPSYAYEDACDDQACLATPTLLRASLAPPSSPTDLSVLAPSDHLWVDADGDISFTEPIDPMPYKQIVAKHYAYVIYLHGKNPPREHWPQGYADRRIAGWRYQVDYEGDATNIIRDGGGIDFLGSLSGFDVSTNNPDPRNSDLFIVQDEGLPHRGAWGIRVTVGVPQILQVAGPEAYWAYLLSPVLYDAPVPPPAGSSAEEICTWQHQPAVQQAYRAWRLTTMQFSPGTVQAVASDASRCVWRHETNMYHYYDGVTVPSTHGWRCEPDAYPGEAGAIDLALFPTDSDIAVKRFQIEVETAAGPFLGGGDPPGWIPCARRWRPAARR